MTTSRWDGSAQQALATAKRWDGASMVDLTVAQRWDGSAWTSITLPGGSGGLSATISPGDLVNLYNPSSGPSTATLTTGSSTVTAVGGSGAGPTYSWAQVNGSSGITINSPSSATTSFTAVMSKNSERSGTFRCTVTRGADSVTVDVSVYLAYYVGAIP